MLNNIVTFVCAPLMLLQAIWLRFKVVRLPEPEGKRSGTGNNNLLTEKAELESVKVLILGDSAAAGVGVTRQEEALSGHVIKSLSKSFFVDWRLEAKSGYTTQDAIVHAQNLPPGSYDIVLLSLGVNDVTSVVGTKKWLSVQAQLVDLLKDKFSPQMILMTAVPPFSLFPAIPNPLRHFLAKKAHNFNDQLEEFCTNDDTLHYLSVDFPLDTGYFAIDGFHPSAKGYALWGESASNVINGLTKG